jgi:mannan endo-1,4-beta-mannosidase
MFLRHCFYCFFSLALLMAGSLFQPQQSFALTDAESFVTRQGKQFYLNGNEFKFVGFNLFDAAGAGNSPYSCPATNGWFPKYTDQELDTAMKEMRAKTGTTVLRFWAFQKYTNGGTDWSGIDKVINLARQNGLKVMPVLEDGPGYCTEPGGGHQWLQSGQLALHTVVSGLC